MKSEMSCIPVFVAVAESDSFAQAAVKLHLTRSAVAKNIARLEERLRVTLFNRTTRSQSLTHEGALYYDYCRRAMNELHAVEELLEEGRVSISGKLRVSVPVLFGHLCIASLLTALTRQHSGLELEISFSDRMVDLTEEGFDLAIRIGELSDSSSLVARKLASHRMALCAAPSYLKDAGIPHSPEALRQHAAIAYIRSGRVQKWRLMAPDGTALDVQPVSRLMMDDMQAIKDATLSGAGIAWLPLWLIREELAAGMLKEVLSSYSTGKWPVYAVWPRMPHMPPKIRLTVDELVRVLPDKMALVDTRA